MLKTMSAAFLLLILTVTIMAAKQQLDDDDVMVKNEDVSSGSGCSESPFISKIAPASDHDHVSEPIGLEQLSTYVQQLNDAGVRTNANIKTLSYTELSRLLALWQLSHQRNYYDLSEEKNAKYGSEESALAPPPPLSAKPKKHPSPSSIDEEVIVDKTLMEDQHKKHVTRF